MGQPPRSLRIETKVSVMLVLVSFIVFTPQGVQSQYISLTGLHLRLPGRCMYGEFDCGFGSCVPVTAFHNGQPDCRDGSDEWCFFGQIKCGSMCINFLDSHGCHRKDEDDRNCNITQPFPCKGYGQIVSMNSLMNGVKDCSDNSDEDPLYVKTLEGSFRCWYDRLLQPEDSAYDLRPEKGQQPPSDVPPLVEFGNFVTPVDNSRANMIVPINVGNKLESFPGTSKVPTTDSSMVLGSIVYSRYMQTSTPTYQQETSKPSVQGSNVNSQPSFRILTTLHPISNEIEEISQETEFFPEMKKPVSETSINDFFGKPITPINSAEIQGPASEEKQFGKTHDKIDVWVFPGQIPSKPIANDLYPSPVDQSSELEYGSSSKNKYEVLEPFKPVGEPDFSQPINPAKVVVIRPLSPLSVSSSSFSSKPIAPTPKLVYSSSTDRPPSTLTSSQPIMTSTELFPSHIPAVATSAEPDWFPIETDDSNQKPTIIVATDQTVEENVKHLNIGGEEGGQMTSVIPFKTVDVFASQPSPPKVEAKPQKPPFQEVPIEENISSTSETPIESTEPENENQSENENQLPENSEKETDLQTVTPTFAEGCYENVMNNLPMSRGSIPICLERYSTEQDPQTLRHAHLRVNTVCGRNVTVTRDVEDALLFKRYEKENATLCRNTFDENIITISCNTCDFDNFVHQNAESEISFAAGQISSPMCEKFETIITSTCIKCVVMDGSCGCNQACSISAIGWLLILLGILAMIIGCCWLYNFFKKIDRMEANWFTDIYDKVKFWITTRTHNNTTSHNNQAQGNNHQATDNTTRNENGAESSKTKKFVAPRKHAMSSRVGDGASTSVASAMPSTSIPEVPIINISPTPASNTILVKPKKDSINEVHDIPNNSNPIEPVIQISNDINEFQNGVKKESLKISVNKENEEEAVKKISPPSIVPVEIDNMIETAVLTSVAKQSTVSNPVPTVPPAEPKRNSIERNNDDKTMWESFKESKHTGERIHSSSSLEQTIIEAKPEIVRKWNFAKRRPTSKERRRCRVGYVPPLTPKKVEPEVPPPAIEPPPKLQLEEPIIVSEGSTDNLMTPNDKKALIDLSRNNINLENPFAKFEPKRVRSHSKSVPNILKITKHKATFRSTDTSPSRSFKQDMLTEAVGPEINERSQTEFINFASSANRNENSSTAPIVIDNHFQSTNASENSDHISRSLPTKTSEIANLNNSSHGRLRSTSRRKKIHDAETISSRNRTTVARTANSLQGSSREETLNKGFFSTRHSGRSFLRSSQSTIVERKKNATADASTKSDTKVEKPKRASKSRQSRTEEVSKSSNGLANDRMSTGHNREHRHERPNVPRVSRTALNTASTSNDASTYHRHVMERNLSRQRRDRHESSTQKYHRTKEELWWDN